VLGFSALLVLFLRGGVLAVLTQIFDLPPLIFVPVTVMLSILALYYALRSLRPHGEKDTDEILPAFRNSAVILIGYSLILRFLYMGTAELIHEEAYYWHYGFFLDLSYLDHPPMVGWLIALFTSILGNIEFAVRMGAMLCWFVTAYYVYRLARVALGKAVAKRASVLVAVLPLFFAFGFVMTPDAPLIACWAGAAYYFYRAIVDERPRAWIAAGAFIGLGMISKYTIVLLGVSTVVYLLLDRRARKWLLRPEPYLGAVLAVVLFSPVILWNAGNDWASFGFQGTKRLQSRFDFDLPELIGSVTAMLTPAGIFSAGAAVWCRKLFAGGDADGASARGYHFLITVTLIPLAVFTGFSLSRNSAFNWTAPLWVGIIPYVAVFTLRSGHPAAARFPRLARSHWPITLGVVLVLYAAALHYTTLGLPAAPYPERSFPVGMHDVAAQIERVLDDHPSSEADKPLVVTLEFDQMSSWIGFYRANLNDARPDPRQRRIPGTSGGHFFGWDSHMHRFWYPVEVETGRTLLVVSDDRALLESPEIIDAHGQSPREIGDLVFHKNGRSAGHWYYRFLPAYTP